MQHRTSRSRKPNRPSPIPRLARAVVRAIDGITAIITATCRLVKASRVLVLLVASFITAIGILAATIHQTGGGGLL